MIYDTDYKSDLVSGASIYVKVPEAQVDYKALYTIQKDPPDFLLPFHYRNVDGQFEFVYKTESLDIFEALWGVYSPKEYTEIWHSLLHPLLDCGEWFLKPYSFILNVEKLYYDAEKAAIRYMYIPSVRDCCDFLILKEMVTTFASRISAHDPELELKVLRIIMNDFSPKSLAQMLKPFSSGCPASTESIHNKATDVGIFPTQISASTQLFPDENDTCYDAQNVETNAIDEIFITLPEETTASKKHNKSKKQKETLMDMGIPNDKKQTRIAKKEKPKTDGFFNRLRHAGKDIIIE